MLYFQVKEPCLCLSCHHPLFSHLLSVLSPLTSSVNEECLLKTLVISCLLPSSDSSKHVHTNGNLPGDKSAEWVCLFHLYTCLVFLFISNKLVCVCGFLCPCFLWWNPLVFNKVGTWSKRCPAVGLLYWETVFFILSFTAPLPHLLMVWVL